MKTLCIYHAECVAGLLAAWAVHRALGAEVEFHAAKYGDDPPEGDLASSALSWLGQAGVLLMALYLLCGTAWALPSISITRVDNLNKSTCRIIPITPALRRLMLLREWPMIDYDYLENYAFFQNKTDGFVFYTILRNFHESCQFFLPQATRSVQTGERDCPGFWRAENDR